MTRRSIGGNARKGTNLSQASVKVLTARRGRGGAPLGASGHCWSRFGSALSREDQLSRRAGEVNLLAKSLAVSPDKASNFPTPAASRKVSFAARAIA